MDQSFTFRPRNQRRLTSAEADQALASQECQNTTFSLGYIRQLRSSATSPGRSTLPLDPPQAEGSGHCDGEHEGMASRRGIVRAVALS